MRIVMILQCDVRSVRNGKPKACGIESDSTLACRVARCAALGSDTLTRLLSHNARATPSTVTFQPAGNPGAALSAPSQPAAMNATAYRSAPLLGKYGVGTRVPPVG